MGELCGVYVLAKEYITKGSMFIVSQYLPEFSSICNTRRYWSLPKYEYFRYRKILGNTGYTSIADTGRFWKILVIPAL
jgi:hypothetical protein